MKTINRIRALAAGLVLGLSGFALAATFNLFSPATGILKGNANTYVTTAAASSDVIGLWTGTCNSGTFLRADGTCQATAGGTVTSVGLTVPTGLSVAGSPVTTSGTLAISTTLNGVLKGDGSGFSASDVDLSSEVTGTLPWASVDADSSDIIGLWTGTCNSGTFLRGDGSCQSPGGAGTVTSITAGTGLSASPSSPITSSGTLEIDTAVVPRLGSANTFSALQTITHTSSASNDPGFVIASGRAVMNIWDTDVTDDRIAIQNVGGTFRIDALNAAATVLNSAVTIEQTAGVVDSIDLAGTVIRVNNKPIAQTGNYTGTLVGCTATVNPTIYWSRSGDIVTLRVAGSQTCTSNTTSFEISGEPASIRPTSGTWNSSGFQPVAGFNNSAFGFTFDCAMSTSANLVCRNNGNAVGWTNSGTKGLANPVITYNLTN